MVNTGIPFGKPDPEPSGLLGCVSPLSSIPHETGSKYSEQDEIFRGQECGGSSTRPTQCKSFFNSLTLFGQLFNFPEDVKDSK